MWEGGRGGASSVALPMSVAICSCAIYSRPCRQSRLGEREGRGWGEGFVVYVGTCMEIFIQR